MDTTLKQGLRVHRAVRLIGLFVWLMPATTTGLAQQPQLQITSPADGTVVTPGQTILVSVTSPTGTAFSNVVVIAGSLGFSDTASSLPAQFSFSIPANVPNGQYPLVAFGQKTTGESVQSPMVHIHTERLDAATGIAAQSNTLIFQSLGEQLPISVSATYAGGVTADVTGSSNLTFSSSNHAVATVDSTGRVTAVGPGNTNIIVRYAQGTSVRQITVAITVLRPALTPSPAQLTFNGVNVGSTASAPITLTNTTKSNNNLKITAISAAGDFSETDNCVSPAPLPVGSQCTATVTFAPTTTGTRHGALSVSNNFSPPMVLPLTGKATSRWAPPAPPRQ